MAEQWTTQPGITVLLQRLRDLSLRIARVDAQRKLARAMALVRVHVPPETA